MSDLSLTRVLWPLLSTFRLFCLGNTVFGTFWPFSVKPGSEKWQQLQDRWTDRPVLICGVRYDRDIYYRWCDFQENWQIDKKVDFIWQGPKKLAY